MGVIVIGEPYPFQDLRKLEGFFFDYSDGVMVLTCVLHNMTKTEELALRAGSNAKVGLFMYDDVIYFAYKCGKLEGDCGFHINRGKDRDNSVPEIEEGCGLPLLIIGVEGNTNIVKAIRHCGLGTNFSRKFRIMCNNQRLFSFDMEEFTFKIGKVHSRLSCKDIMRMATATYKLGSPNEDNEDNVSEALQYLHKIMPIRFS